MRFDSSRALIAAALVLAARIHAQAPVIRPMTGLTLTVVNHDERGDEETFAAIAGLTPTEYDLQISSNIPNPAHPAVPDVLNHDRRVRLVDDSLAHRLNIIVASNDPQIFPGSTIFFSKAMLAELKASGTTAAVVGDAPPGAFTGFLANFLAGRQYYRGELTRGGHSTLSVIVHGTPTPLPVIEVRGHLTVAGQGDDVDALVFDNPSWPITLRWTSQGRAFQITAIDWPATGVRDQGVARGGLAGLSGKTCRAEVHGIYFAFGSAILVPQSDVALTAVSDLLRANSSWVVTIEGHTDNIGSKASNLDLSERRAAAVRDALVTRFHIVPARLSATGFGDTRPVAPNGTVEGRARNRRVELSRKC
jgi:outer membrane protein OmpA-like peptidoglycan-associated protein